MNLAAIDETPCFALTLSINPISQPIKPLRQSPFHTYTLS